MVRLRFTILALVLGAVAAFAALRDTATRLDGGEARSVTTTPAPSPSDFNVGTFAETASAPPEVADDGGAIAEGSSVRSSTRVSTSGPEPRATLAPDGSFSFRTGTSTPEPGRSSGGGSRRRGGRDPDPNQLCGLPGMC